MLTTDIYGKTLSNSFNTAITSYAQKVKPRIIIDFLDLRHLDNLSVTTNDPHSNTAKGSIGYYFSKDQVGNGLERQTFTWAVCNAKDKYGDVIKSDGTYFAMPSSLDNNLEYGWWSGTKSQANTDPTYTDYYGFATDPYVEMTFDERKVNKIVINTAEFHGQIKNYRLEVFNGATSILDESGFIEDGTYFKEHIVETSAAKSANYATTKIKVTVYTTKNPTDYARIHSVVPLYQVDITDYIVDYSISRTRDLHETNLPIGGSSSAKLTVSLDNTSKDFSRFSAGSEYGPYMYRDLKVHVSTGWQIKRSDDIISNTALSANISNSSTTINVYDADIFPDGGTGNEFTIKIDAGTQSEEVILCSAKASDKSLTASQRGYANTTAVAHLTDAVVSFDTYEYISGGTFYIDDWSATSEMSVGFSANDWSKFLTEKTMERGFFQQNTTVGDSIENLLMHAGFPKGDYKQLNSYSDGIRKLNPIASWSFKEPTIDRSGNVIIPSTGLRARFWGMPESRKDSFAVGDILADAIDKVLSPLDLALGEKAFTAPSFVTLSKSISNSNAAINFQSYTFTGADGDTYESFYNGVIDGYYVPIKHDASGEDFVITVRRGAVRLYVDDTLVIDSWKRNVSSTTLTSYETLGRHLNLTPGQPYKLRLEFAHYAGTFDLSMSIKYIGANTTSLIPATDCYTIVPLDSVGSKEESYLIAQDNFNHYRNNGVYVGTPTLGIASGIAGESDNKAVTLSNSAYIRIPYDETLDFANTVSPLYTGTWSIELYVKLTGSPYSGDGEYLSTWNNSNATSGFEFYSNSSGHGFKVYDGSSVKTVSNTTPLSNSAFTHVVVSHQGNNMKYYINGQKVDTTGSVHPFASWANRDITIGGRNATFLANTGEVAPSTIRSLDIDEFAIYKRELSQEEISDRYTATQMQPLGKFPFLYGGNSTIREIIDGIAIADLGRLYIDEEDYARYEHFYRLYENTIAQHSQIQSTFSDSTNIVSGDYNVQLQANKVVVKVAGLSSAKIGTQSLWRAPDPTSLAAVTLTANLTANATSMYVNTTDDPVFPTSGYIKIDSEIIKYSSKSSSEFLNLERGALDTTAATHTANALVREVKYFDAQYDKAPAFNVKNPLISEIDNQEPDLIEIHKFEAQAYSANLIVAASNNVNSGEIVFLEGTNPLTDKVAYAAIAGIPVITTEQNSQVMEQSEALTENIRKYGLKEVVIDSPYITDAVQAQKLATFIINKMQDPVPIITINTLAMPKIQLGDRIRISSFDALDITDVDYWVVSHDMNVGDTLTHSITLRKAS
jgi:hypothetical protein